MIIGHKTASCSCRPSLKLSGYHLPNERLNLFISVGKKEAKLGRRPRAQSRPSAEAIQAAIKHNAAFCEMRHFSLRAEDQCDFCLAIYLTEMQCLAKWHFWP